MKKVSGRPQCPLSIVPVGEVWFWLLALAAGLALVHISLVSQSNDGSLMASSLLFWVAIGSLIWSRKSTFVLESGFVSTLLAAALLALLLVKSAFIQGYDPFLRVAPLLFGLSMGLLASGLKGVRQYGQELLVFAFLAPPPSLISSLIDTSPVTARVSTLILWYAGFNVQQQGVNILLPNGGVEVYSGCSGIDLMLNLLGLSVLFLIMFPVSRVQRIILPALAVAIAFLVNAVRVAIMAVLSTPSTQSAFEYWHKGNGSLLFSMMAVFFLGGYCFFILHQEESAPHQAAVNSPVDASELWDHE